MAPGSLDRLVQITGSASENVAQAKNLVHDTIRRNQSPLPDTFGDHNDGENNNIWTWQKKIRETTIQKNFLIWISRSFKKEASDNTISYFD